MSNSIILSDVYKTLGQNYILSPLLTNPQDDDFPVVEFVFTKDGIIVSSNLDDASFDHGDRLTVTAFTDYDVNTTDRLVVEGNDVIKVEGNDRIDVVATANLPGKFFLTSKTINLYKQLTISSISDFSIGITTYTSIVITSHEHKTTFDTLFSGESVYFCYTNGSDPSKFTFEWNLNGTVVSNYDNYGITENVTSSGLPYAKLILSDNTITGTYSVTVSDSFNVGLSATSVFKVKALEVNVGFQGKINTVGNDSFVGSIFSKDDSKFHFVHNVSSQISDIDNLVNKQNIEYAPIKSSNLNTINSTNIANKTYITLNSPHYSISSDAKVVIELIYGYSNGASIMFNSYILNDNNTYHITSFSVSTNTEFNNIKYALSATGNTYVVHYKDIVGESVFHVYQNTESGFVELNFARNIEESNEIIDMCVLDTKLGLLSQQTFCLFDFDSENIIYDTHSLVLPQNIIVNEKKQVFIKNDTDLETLTEEITMIYPVIVSTDSVDVFLQILTEDIRDKLHKYDVDSIINYSGKSYKVKNSQVVDTDSISDVSTLTIVYDEHINFEDVLIETNYTSKIQTCGNHDIKIDNNNVIFSLDDVSVRFGLRKINEDSVSFPHTLDCDTDFPNFIGCSIVPSLNSFESLCISQFNSNTNVITLETFNTNLEVHIGDNIDDTNNTIIGQFSTGNGYRNQVLIGKMTYGIQDNSVVLGNSETNYVLPQRNNSCHIGEINHKFESISTNKIAFGSDLMTLPQSDGKEDDVLIRQGKCNLTWGNVPQALNKLKDIYADNVHQNIHLPMADDRIMYANVSEQEHGKHNTAYGYEALKQITTGSENSCFGFNAGQTLSTGSGNTLIGANTVTSLQESGENQTVIGNSAQGYKDNTITLGNTDVTTIVPGADTCDLGDESRMYNGLYCKTVDSAVYIRCKGPIQSYSDRTLKTDIKKISNSQEFIRDIEPVQFKFKESGKSSLGFIAQEVDKISQQCNIEGVTELDEKGLFTLNYQAIIAPLVNVVQAQCKIIAELQEKMIKLEHKLSQE